jgi:hypothetical protein
MIKYASQTAVEVVFHFKDICLILLVNGFIFYSEILTDKTKRQPSLIKW